MKKNKLKFLLFILTILLTIFIGKVSASGPITKTLKYGMKDIEVKYLQQTLNEKGYAIAKTGAGAKGLETTYFGNATKTAVKTYQKAKGLVADGIFGAKSRATLGSTFPPVITNYPPVGCSQNAIFNTLTGARCDGKVVTPPVVRGGGSSGGGGGGGNTPVTPTPDPSPVADPPVVPPVIPPVVVPPVTPPPANTPQTIFTTQVPASFGGGLSYELGTKFKTNTDGTVTKVRIYTSATESGNHTVRLWRVNDNTVLSGPHIWNITAGTAGWKEYTLPASVNIQSGIDYIVSISNSPDKTLAATTGAFNSPINNNNLITYVGSGTYSTTLGTMPTQIYSNSNYFRDIVFVPGDIVNPPTPPAPPSGDGINYYASPTGTGNGGSISSPFKIADFWAVAKPGNTLYLLDGTYTGTDSMIQPPTGISGTAGNPITISALNDGKVLIDGEGVHGPVLIQGNNWLVLEGFNASHAKSQIGSWENSIVYILDSNHIIVRRVIGWDAADGNTNIFGANYSNNILFEDIAGFGMARKIVSPGHRENSDYNQDNTNNIVRRAYARLEKSSLNNNTTCDQVAISLGYNTNGGIIENSIVTNQGYLGVTGDCKGDTTNRGFHDDRNWDERNQLLGSIAYRTSEQSVAGSDTMNPLNAQGVGMRIRDMLVAIEEPESTYGKRLKNTARFYDYGKPGFDARYMTFMGGPGLHLSSLGGAVISNIIVTGATWNKGFDNKIDNAVVPATGLFIPVAAYWPAPDYVMLYNNTNNWNAAPAHSSIEDPNLIGRCGNILQYGCTEAQRPKVAGQSVGAQIQCRYENGTLTNKPLWPWPMNERIRVATCMYDNNLSQSQCEANTSLGVNVTKTIFELNGGSVPNFDSINPTVCPGAISLSETPINLLANTSNTDEMLTDFSDKIIELSSNVYNFLAFYLISLVASIF